MSTTEPLPLVRDHQFRQLVLEPVQVPLLGLPPVDDGRPVVAPSSVAVPSLCMSRGHRRRSRSQSLPVLDGIVQHCPQLSRGVL